MKMTGFKLLGSEPIFGSAAITIREDTIKMNKAVGYEMHDPQQIQFLLNVATKQLIIRACAPDAPNSRAYCSADANEKKATRRINAVVVSAVRSLMNWAEGQNMTVGGTYLPSEKAMLFDLQKAQPIRVYNRKEVEA